MNCMQRGEVIARAAVDLVAEHGLKGLTHRGVDARAGLPLGSASNVFRTRRALLAGVLRHILEEERREMLAVPRPSSAQELLDNAEAMVTYLLGEGLSLTRARYAIFLEALAHPDLQQDIAAATRTLTEVVADMVRPLVNDPDEAEARASLVIAAIDAVLLSRLVRPVDASPTRAAIGALLDGALRSPLHHR